MNLRISILIVLCLLSVSCMADTSTSYPVGKTRAYDVGVFDYLTVDQITDSPSLKDGEGYILSMPVCIESDGDSYQFALLYAPSINTPVTAYTFRKGDTRGVTGYFKPGDKVKIDRSTSDWKMEKV